MTAAWCGTVVRARSPSWHSAPRSCSIFFSSNMRLDIRLPIGVLFTAIGAMLVIFGVTSDSALYARSLGHNVNLWWGLVLLLFGGTFTRLGWRGARSAPPPDST